MTKHQSQADTCCLHPFTGTQHTNHGVQVLDALTIARYNIRYGCQTTIKTLMAYKAPDSLVVAGEFDIHSIVSCSYIV